jgi:NifB/MoaA-like Fe-S oxidoreductase
MEQSIRDLVTLWPTVQSISVVPVGLTKQHRYGLHVNTPAQANAVLDACDLWQEKFRAELGVGFVYPTDEWYLITGRALPPLERYDDLALRENGLGMVRAFLEEWQTVRAGELKALQPRFERITLVTGRLFAPVLAQSAAELSAATGLQIAVQGITNAVLGEGITVSGLLMGADVIAQLKPLQESGELGDLVVLPHIMFDHPDGICLDDKSPLDVARALNRPVALADLMGDVIDALQGQNALLFDPNHGDADSPIMRDGGWAVEKYL